jgi:hypothetical protein
MSLFYCGIEVGALLSKRNIWIVWTSFFGGLIVMDKRQKVLRYLKKLKRVIQPVLTNPEHAVPELLPACKQTALRPSKKNPCFSSEVF